VERSLKSATFRLPRPMGGSERCGEGPRSNDGTDGLPQQLFTGRVRQSRTFYMLAAWDERYCGTYLLRP